MSESTLDERFGGVLAPDAMLPAQFFGALQRRAGLSGERRLMVAVLEDALECYQKHVDADDSKHRQLFLDAEEWINTDNPTWFFSFANVCMSLDLDPDYVRDGLAKWRDGRRRDPERRTPAAAPSTSEPADDETPLRRASA